jgi:hypothetical protein
MNIDKNEILKNIKTDLQKTITKVGNSSVEAIRSSISKTSSNNPSAPGKPPNKVSGNLVRSIGYSVKLNSSEIVLTIRSDSTIAPYNLDLEFGNSRIEPRPFMAPGQKVTERLLKKEFN